jgi:L-lactate dehydrogenase complex protein LldG
MVDDARSVILGRVRAALRDVEGDVEVPRSYGGGAGDGDPVELFAERVGEYRATVRRGLGALAEACRGRRLVVPADLPAAWRPDGAELVVDDGLDVHALDAIDGALTGCALAIAETGTIVLDAGPGQGRRTLTLVPDLHVCVVPADRVVAGVPEAIAALGDAAREGRPITLISGPSATSDIELERVEGVHGPRTLDVVIIDRGDRG